MTPATTLLLDCIRFVLASIVLVGHAYGLFILPTLPASPPMMPPPQSIAVVGFFFLSGFLIVFSTLRSREKGEGSLGQYLFDRATRIYITLVPCLLGAVLIDVVLTAHVFQATSTYTVNTSASHLIHNLILKPSMPFGGMRPIWSLMYEWWIYIAFGGIFFFRRHGLICAALLVPSLYYTFSFNARGEAGHIWLIWAFGGFCAWAWTRPWIDKVSRSVWIVCLLICAATASMLYHLTLNAYNLLAGLAGSSALFALLALSRQWCGLPSQAFANVCRLLAGYSFTLFLIHYNVLIFLKDVLGLTTWTAFFFGIVLSHAVSYALAAGTELRLQQSRDWIARVLKIPNRLSRRTSPASAPADARDPAVHR